MQDEGSSELLQLIYRLSGGDTNEIISKKNLGRPLGLSQQETNRLVNELVAEGMVRHILFNALCITHLGVLAAEPEPIPPPQGQPGREPGPAYPPPSAAQAPAPQQASPPIPILFLSADPTDLARLRLGEEAREIHEKLQLARQRDRFELCQRTSVRPEDISQALLDVQPAIVHFSGHGTPAGAICVEGRSGEALPIEAAALALLFEQFREQVECVVLNACYSEAQANAIVQHIDYVVGVSQEIDDKAAIAFAVGFYQALGAGRSIEDAYKLGCVQIRLRDIPENLTPVLKKRGA
jgi:hypothetical protein